MCLGEECAWWTRSKKIPINHLKILSKHLSAGSTAWRGCPEQVRERTTGPYSRDPERAYSSSVAFQQVPQSYLWRGKRGSLRIVSPCLPILQQNSSNISVLLLKVKSGNN